MAQDAAAAKFQSPEAWCRSAVLNVARSGRFSSDRAIQEYADRVWHAESLPPV
jgi:starch phosphorylase